MDRTEKCILTNMCMVYENEKILVLDRIDPNWSGVTFPGGHVEKEESFVKSVVREIYEETGLEIKNPKLCGIKQFTSKDKTYRYIVLLYKTNEFSGVLKSSTEGKVFWINKTDVSNYKTVNNFYEILEVFDNDMMSENFNFYDDEKEEWRCINS